MHNFLHKRYAHFKLQCTLNKMRKSEKHIITWSTSQTSKWAGVSREYDHDVRTCNEGRLHQHPMAKVQSTTVMCTGLPMMETTWCIGGATVEIQSTESTNMTNSIESMDPLFPFTPLLYHR